MEKRWEVKLEELRRYRNRTGHCNVLEGEDAMLYRWVRRERATYRSGVEGWGLGLSNERIAALREVGLDLDFVSFAARLDELQMFRRKNGHINVPRGGKGSLGDWVWKIRSTYRNLTRRKRPKGVPFPAFLSEALEDLRRIGFDFESPGPSGLDGPDPDSDPDPGEGAGPGKAGTAPLPPREGEVSPLHGRPSGGKQKTRGALLKNEN
jgi:hypothetical protein